MKPAELVKKCQDRMKSIRDKIETKRKSKKVYSEEDMRKAYDQGIDDSFDMGFSSKDDTNFNVFIKQFKNKLI
jgi:flagellar biosynthesis chaperone FliJ